MNSFNPYIRSVEVNWLIAQIKTILHTIEVQKNSTWVIYGCLEARNLIERIEFELLAMAAKTLDKKEFFDLINLKNGISQTNKKLNSLKFKYQSFSKVITEVLFENLNLKIFDFKQAEDLANRLSKHLHIYSKSDEDMLIESEFMQDGIHNIKDTLEFVNSYFVEIKPGEVVYGIFDFRTLKSEVKQVFNDWVSDVKNDEKSLKLKLEAINNKYNNGLQTKINLG